MNPVVAHQVGKSIVNDRVKQAETARMAQQARKARMSERSEARAERASDKASRLLAGASNWVRTRITSASAS
jgi:hypothetical protein